MGIRGWIGTALVVGGIITGVNCYQARNAVKHQVSEFTTSGNPFSRVTCLLDPAQTDGKSSLLTRLARTYGGDMDAVKQAGKMIEDVTRLTAARKNEYCRLPTFEQRMRTAASFAEEVKAVINSEDGFSPFKMGPAMQLLLNACTESEEPVCHYPKAPAAPAAKPNGAAKTGEAAPDAGAGKDRVPAKRPKRVRRPRDTML